VGGDAQFVRTGWRHLRPKSAIDLLDDGPDALAADRFSLAHGE